MAYWLTCCLTDQSGEKKDIFSHLKCKRNSSLKKILKRKKREMRSRTLTSKGADTKKDSPAPS